MAQPVGIQDSTWAPTIGEYRDALWVRLEDRFNGKVCGRSPLLELDIRDKLARRGVSSGDQGRREGARGRYLDWRQETDWRR